MSLSRSRMSNPFIDQKRLPPDLAVGYVRWGTLTLLLQGDDRNLHRSDVKLVIFHDELEEAQSSKNQLKNEAMSSPHNINALILWNGESKWSQGTRISLAAARVADTGKVIPQTDQQSLEGMSSDG